MSRNFWRQPLLRRTSLRRAIGSIGESLAARFLTRNYFAIWKRNWRCEAGELDLIAIRNRCLHLVEVKTRFCNRSAHTTLDQLTERKQEKLRQLAEQLLHMHALAFRRRRIRSTQIDFIGIDISFSGFIPRYTITWLPDIVPIADPRTQNFYEKYNSYPRHSP